MSDACLIPDTHLVSGIPGCVCRGQPPSPWPPRAVGNADSSLETAGPGGAKIRTAREAGTLEGHVQIHLVFLYLTVPRRC